MTVEEAPHRAGCERGTVPAAEQLGELNQRHVHCCLNDVDAGAITGNYAMPGGLNSFGGAVIPGA